MLWIGFSLAIILLLILSRRDLALGMGVATITLAIFTLSMGDFGAALSRTFTDPSVYLLALVVGMIPLIGGAMEATGQMDRLVSNLRIGTRPFLAISPALMGMLPMPGGALMSAPMVERGAAHAPGDIKAAANVWFRHALLLVYPLGSALIASAKIAGLELYGVIPYLVPPFLLTLVLGYLFLLRSVSGKLPVSGPFSLAGLLVPLSIILAAPVLDLTLKQAIRLPYSEIGTAVGVAVSLVLAFVVGHVRLPAFGRILKKAKPWKYMLIIVAMFAFLNVFASSGVPERIGAMALPPVVLCVVLGFALGLITGRIQAPISIVIPIYVSTYGTITASAFAVTYFAIFMGFVLTPIHPCVSVSLEYFDSSLGAFLRKLAIPSIIALVSTLVVGYFLF